MIFRSGEAGPEYEEQAAELVALRLGESGEDLVLGFPLGMGGTVEPALAGGREGDDVPAPGAGELLVRVQASSVNPVDNAIAAGMLSGMGVEHEFPVTLGRDYAGVVEQVGATGWGGRRGGRGGGSGRHQRDAVLDLVSYAPGAFDGALKADGRVASPNGAAGDGPGRTNVMASPTTENLERLAGLLEEGVEVPIQETYGLARVPEALAALGTTHTRGKLAIRVG